MRIFVGHLPWSTTEEALARLFAPYGLVDSTQIAPALRIVVHLPHADMTA